MLRFSIVDHAMQKYIGYYATQVRRDVLIKFSDKVVGGDRLCGVVLGLSR